jgi:hypothetical protein
MATATPRTAVLMITVWLDDGESSLLRARLTEIPDLGRPSRTFATVSNAAGVLRATSEWLAQVQGGNAVEPT